MHLFVMQEHNLHTFSFLNEANKLLQQEIQKSRFQSSLRTFYGQYNELVSKYCDSLRHKLTCLLDHYLYSWLTTVSSVSMILTMSTPQMRQGMLTFPGHLVLPLPFKSCSALNLHFALWIFEMVAIFH